MPDPDLANILIVDDKPDKLLTLETVLADLPINVIKAESGREALRCLLKRDVAVILLDVNMPGMDGFETARLIRQRPSSEHTPILFITAYSDDMQVTLGYSLGAVDYILAPVVPDVLKTKVRVFIDLYRATQEVKRQAARLEQRAAQLHQLNQASLVINSTLSLDRMLQLAADTACAVIGARQSVLLDLSDEAGRRRRRVPSPLQETNNGTHFETPSALEMRLVSSPVTNSVTRLMPGELERLLPPGANGLVPSDSLLVAPLASRESRKIGLLCVSGKIDGEFTAEDEALLSQLAQMTAVAIENTLFAEAREANRVKEEFLATLSHELRTPLTAMLGWTQLLRAGAPDPAEVSHGLEIIERNVRAQAKLIDDLLEVSRIVAGKLRLNLQPVVLPAVIGAALDVVRPTAENKGLTINTEIATETSVLLGDPDRLQQVVWNLLANAVKFTPAGGRISVVLQESNSTATITVRDSGQGIPTSFLPYLFDRFRQADSSSTRHYGGLGIGLALVRHLVELHGGRVTAESAGEGQGATFTVVLPLQSAYENPAHPAGASGGSVEGELRSPDISLIGLRVLVVDDEPDARDVLCRSLKSFGAEVHVAGSAYEALECLDKVMPDVLVADIGMPEMDGYSLIRCLRRLPAHEGGAVPAVALTAFVRDDDRKQALSAGFQLHAGKPITPRELATLVGSLAGRVGMPGLKTESRTASRDELGCEGCVRS